MQVNLKAMNTGLRQAEVDVF